MIDVNRISDEQMSTQVCRLYRYKARVESLPIPPIEKLEETILKMKERGHIYITASSPCWYDKYFWLPDSYKDIVEVPFDSLFFSEDSVYFCCDADRDNCCANVYTVHNYGGEWSFNKERLIERCKEWDRLSRCTGAISIGKLYEEE